MFYGILSIFVWLFVAITSIIFFPIALLIFLVTLPFDRNRRILHSFSCFWASSYVWINPLWDLHWEGKELIEKDKPFVFVSNHQSLLDIILLYNLFTHFKWVSKDSLFNIPFIGWNMSLNGYIKLRRKDPKSHLNLIKEAGKHLQRGSSIILFPEGTRSPDGDIHRFKDGAFLIAKKYRVGVQPIVLDGAYQAIPKKGLMMNHKQRINIRVLPPISAETVGQLRVKDLSIKIKEDMDSNLKEIRV
ncbi:lysophospholipid acyltransferase family protein [Spirochaeta cellobiosiphila]|uniref:lysophospholipid acyltransferase family protein n=1 Tax=Spirochaeta cellobiosiphila TaxID=504483 RepID=UPI000404DB59|nr:1-acyl-sn-glycerol-3-phosphate acyltransferase [Spirochaeta cellobiosiphila]